MTDQITIYHLEESFTALCGDSDSLFGDLGCMFRERGCLIDRGCPRGKFVLDYNDLNPLRGVSRDEIDDIEDRIDEDLLRVDLGEDA